MTRRERERLWFRRLLMEINGKDRPAVLLRYLRCWAKAMGLRWSINQDEHKSLQTGIAER